MFFDREYICTPRLHEQERLCSWTHIWKPSMSSKVMEGRGGKGQWATSCCVSCSASLTGPSISHQSRSKLNTPEMKERGNKGLFPRVHGCLFLSGDPRNVEKHWCSNCFPSRGIDKEPRSHRLWDRALGASVGPAVVARVDLACSLRLQKKTHTFWRRGSRLARPDSRLGWNGRYLGQRLGLLCGDRDRRWAEDNLRHPKAFVVAAGDLFPHKRGGMREIKKDREWREEIKANR